VIEIEPVDPPEVAVMVAVPSPPPMVPTLLPEISPIIDGSLLVKTVWAVTSVPLRVAENEISLPAGSVVRLMLSPSEDVTSRLPWLDCPMVTVTSPDAAPLEVVQSAETVAVAVELVRAVTRPVVFTSTTVGSELVQVQEPVRFWVDPSLKVPVAVSCKVCPLACKVGFCGLIEMLLSVGLTKNPLQPTPLRRRHHPNRVTRRFTTVRLSTQT